MKDIDGRRESICNIHFRCNISFMRPRVAAARAFLVGNYGSGSTSAHRGDGARHAASGDERSEAKWACQGMEHGEAADAARWGLAAAVRRSGAGGVHADGHLLPSITVD